MVSIAIPSSYIGGQESLKEATYALYQICRACVLFNVREIVVYTSNLAVEETHGAIEKPKKIKLDEDDREEGKLDDIKERKDEDLIFTANMLQYLITPQHLRKIIFKPIGNASQFKFASKLPAIPGLKQSKNVLPGIAVPRRRIKKLPGQKKLSKKDRKEVNETTYINVGFDRLFKLKEGSARVNSQVFIDLKGGRQVGSTETGNAFTVRAVNAFSQIFTQSPLKDGYSQTIYVPSQQFKTNGSLHPLMQEVDLTSLPRREDMLIVFGTWSEVQNAVQQDQELELPDAAELFDGVKLGTERARLEDSVMVTLARA